MTELKVLCPSECGQTLTVNLPRETFHNACALGKVIGDALMAHDETCRISRLRDYYDNTDLSDEIAEAEWADDVMHTQETRSTFDEDNPMLRRPRG